MPNPRATYRLQLRPEFDFDAAAAIAGYLADLGVSHAYASPYLQAAPGSTHGYDVVDPTRVNRELGGEEAHRRFCAALGRARLGQVLDIVPNHMAITGPENAWWWDVLRNGPASAYAGYFDVDWDPPEAKLRDMVLMPILGDHYGRELEAGTIRLEHDDGGFTIRYHDHVLPVAPRSLAGALARAAGWSGESGDGGEERGARRSSAAPSSVGDSDMGGDRSSAALAELGFLARSLARLPEPSAGLEPTTILARQRDLEVLDRRLGTLVREIPAVRRAIDAEVGTINADVDALDALLAEQNYRLSYWRTAGEELDYRRFFDISTLAGLVTERPAVFDAVHGRVLDWVREGVLDGLRVDHPDGLRRPAEYFQRLRDAAGEDAWIVGEKILMPEESLPPWPIDGTTGYDFMSDVGGLFVDPAGEAPITALWTELTGDARGFDEVVYEARKDVLHDVLASDLNRLANVFVQVCERRRRYRDFTRADLREALAEVAACFPVYRTYVTEDGAASGTDREVVAHAIGAAKRRRPEIDAELLDFLADILLGDIEGDAARGLRMRFQQFTGPVAAKGEEDTAFYRYLRYSPLNEVGGDPGRWGMPTPAFHARSAAAAREWPLRMTSLSTHDTKRSEDVRARLFTLSEIADCWADAVRRWRAMTAPHWPDAVEPDPTMEYLLYQTLVGAWPISADRAAAYIEKASREAKDRTSWTDPDPDYDAALSSFTRAVLADDAFVADLAGFVEPLVAPGRVVSLAQKLVQLAAPGVPDIYRGTELWDLSLVDPDNRRMVDFSKRAELLEWLSTAPAIERIVERMDDGAPKLWVVRQTLRVRAERPAAFGPDGDYGALEASGRAPEHVVGFLRGGEAAVVVPRLVNGLVRKGWGDTAVLLPAGRWTNVLTGDAVAVDGTGRAPVAGLLARFPVALLVREAS